MKNSSSRPTACGVVAAVGMFDGVHAGHSRVLERVRAEAAARSMRSLALTFSRHPLELVDSTRAPRLLTDTAARVRLLLDSGIDRAEALDFTPAMRSLGGADFLAMLRERYGVAVLVMGYDNHIGSDRLDAAAAAALTPSTGVEVLRVDEYRHDASQVLSSSSVRAALADGRVGDAARMLGRYFSVAGEVVGGNRLGRTIGFPTANVDASAAAALAPGAYAVDVEIDGDGSLLRGMANIGRRPTLGSCGELRLEVNIFGFEGSLYGHRLRVEFLERLRGECTFASLEELARQLDLDRRAAAAVCRRGF